MMAGFRLSRLGLRLLLLVLLAFVPIFGLFVYSSVEQRRANRVEVQQNALYLARDLSSEHEQLIENGWQLLTSLAQIPAIKTLNSRACSALFGRLLEKPSAYANIVAVRPNGDLFCSGRPLLTPVNVGDRDYFRRALEGREFAVGEYLIGRVTGRPSLALAHPALDESGTVRAVVVVALDTTWLHGRAAALGLAEGSVLGVVDPAGRIFARYPDPEKWIGKTATEAAIVRTVLAQHEGVAEEVGLDGVRRLFGFAPLRGGPATSLAHVWIGVPTAVAFAEGDRLLVRNLLALGTVTALALFVAWVGSHVFIRRSVNVLLAAAERLGAGDLSTRTGPPYAGGELGNVAQAFDQMVAALGQQSADLREAEAKYRALVEQSLVGVYLISGDQFVYINQALATVFGYQVDEVIGRLGPMDLVHPEDRALVTENLRARLSGQAEAIRYAFRGLRKDSSTVFCEVFGRRIDYLGEAAILGSLVDVTERVRNEESLRKINRALNVLSRCNEALIQATDEAELLEGVCRILVATGGYRLAWVGLAEADEARSVRPVTQTGYEEGYLETLRITWADTDRGRGPTGTAIRTAKPVVARHILTDPNFAPWRAEAVKRGYASSIALPLTIDDQTLGALNVYAEQPDAFDADEARLLAELADDLAYGIRTLRLGAERIRAEEELRHQREVLYQSEKLAAMGQLLAGVAHELNNPLSVITGHTALLAQGASGPLAQRAGKIGQAAARCARIVKNFLALARQHPPERSEVDLNRVVREAVELLAYPLRVDDVEVVLNLTEEVPVLWADPHHLHQVVVNLVSNAHDAMRRTPPPRRLTVGTRYDSGRGRVWLEIADTGPGIPPEIQGRIFEPFFTTKPVGQGTGLGLSLCQGIVENHRGSIRVESEPGQGARFVVELPVETPPAAKPEAREAEGLPPVRGKRILVVDDEAEVASMLAEMLAADGHQVETAANGALALEKVRERSYDAILSDIKMPELDGPGLYREVEHVRPGARLRFIFLTGDTFGPETREFLEKIQAPSLTKPFGLEEVRRAVGRVLREP